MSQASATAPEIKKEKFKIGMLLLNLRTFIALFLVVIYFSIMAPNFLSMANLLILVKHVSIYAFLAIGMTFVIITGGIDLSVGAIVGLAGMVAGLLLHKGLHIPFMNATIYFHLPMVILITLGVGVLCGAFSGLLITRFRVPPFIATLGMLYIARGAALLLSDGKTFPNLVGSEALGNTGFPWLGSGTILGIPFSICVLVILGIGASYLAKRTPLGRHIYSVGGNERAALLSGVRVNRVKMFVYMFAGFCSAIAGLIIASQLVASHPATGDMFELTAIAAAVLGGTSLAGGRGTIGGTIIGAFVIGVLGDGMVMMGVSSFWQMVIKGLVIVAAVVVDQFQGKLQSRAVIQED
ncbi:MAG: ABC transporter permease [Desulfobacteraceae bacterium]|nr:MAG: ABC transporter permease [Desulfobacteraceae bacterium]